MLGIAAKAGSVASGEFSTEKAAFSDGIPAEMIYGCDPYGHTQMFLFLFFRYD